jgi:hypothetical protein
MERVAGPGRFVGLVFVVIVVVAIVALLAGYGIPVGISALAGFILGALAGLFGALWLTRGMGRSLTFGSMSWSSADASDRPGSEQFAEMRQLSELMQIDLGPIRSIVPVLATSDARGYAVQLVAMEVREGGMLMTLDVRPQPGSPPPGFWADVTVHDDADTAYRAAGQNNGGGVVPARYIITIVPAPPLHARRIDAVIGRFMDPFPGGGRTTGGPWAFSVDVPTRDIDAR